MVPTGAHFRPPEPKVVGSSPAARISFSSRFDLADSGSRRRLSGGRSLQQLARIHASSLAGSVRRDRSPFINASLLLRETLLTSTSSLLPCRAFPAGNVARARAGRRWAPVRVSIETGSACAYEAFLSYACFNFLMSILSI